VSHSDDHERVGSLAEEAAKLFGALSGWTKDHGEGLSSFADDVHDHLSTGTSNGASNGSPECTWCPVCRTVAAVRATSPEVRTHLATAASSLMLAVSGMMATHRPASDPRVERIDLDDDWPEDL
jgi:hypothetical protein